MRELLPIAIIIIIATIFIFISSYRAWNLKMSLLQERSRNLRLEPETHECIECGETFIKALETTPRELDRAKYVVDTGDRITKLNKIWVHADTMSKRCERTNATAE